MLSTSQDDPPKCTLILGASGRVGRLLRTIWDQEDQEGLRPVWQYRQAGGHEGLVLDFMNDEESLHQLLNEVDSVLVLAGVTPSSGIESHDYGLNVEIARTVLEASQQSGVRRVFLTSTAAIYGNSKLGQFGFVESDPASPVSDYGKSKLEMERVAVGFGDLQTCCLRIGNISGADQLLGPGRRDIEIDVFPDGSGPRRTYLGPQMLASIMAQLLTSREDIPKVLNIGGTHPVDMLDLLRAAQINYQTRAAPAGLPETVSLDCSAMRALVNEPKGTDDAHEIINDWLSVTGGHAI